MRRRTAARLWCTYTQAKPLTAPTLSLSLSLTVSCYLASSDSLLHSLSLSPQRERERRRREAKKQRKETKTTVEAQEATEHRQKKSRLKDCVQRKRVTRRDQGRGGREDARVRTRMMTMMMMMMMATPFSPPLLLHRLRERSAGEHVSGTSVPCTNWESEQRMTPASVSPSLAVHRILRTRLEIP